MTEMEEIEYVRECPAGGCDTRFIGMSPDEFREEHAQDGVCEAGPISRLVVFPTDESRKKREEELNT